MFKSLKAAQAWIESVQKFGPKYDLVRMQNATQMLNHPEKKVPMIHVAGTNGKGSTVSFISHILMAAGYRTGMYISPYIESFNERFMINHVPIDDTALLTLINEMHAFNLAYHARFFEHLSFFELTTLLAFEYFNNESLDVAVIEVGIGGRLDATNVITPEVSVITSIGFDHMAILGNTLKEIASEKLGIVKPSVPLVSGVKDAELIELFESTTQKRGAHLIQTDHVTFIPTIPQTFSYQSTPYEINLLGEHQVANAACAIEATRQLNDRGFTISETAIQAGLKDAFWPGRFETLGPFILDGAHNYQGVQSLLKAVDAYFKATPLTIVFGVMGDKDSKAMQTLLEARAETMVFTEVDHPRALAKTVMFDRSMHPNKLMASIDEVASLEGPTLIAGSLYVISATRAKIKERLDAK